MVLRTFFEKDNTIISNSSVNMGKNPIVELFYGGTPNIHSRYLFKFNEERIKEQLECGYLGDLNNLTHVLKMKATASLNEDLLGTLNYDGKERTGSFDLIVFKLNEKWDEGLDFLLLKTLVTLLHKS